MIALLRFLLALMTTPFKPMRRLEAENAALRQQLIVLRRTMKARPRLTNSDRWFFVVLYRLFPSILNAMQIIQPRPWSDGIDLVSGFTGAGSLGITSDGRKST